MGKHSISSDDNHDLHAGEHSSQRPAYERRSTQRPQRREDAADSAVKSTAYDDTHAGAHTARPAQDAREPRQAQPATRHRSNVVDPSADARAQRRAAAAAGSIAADGAAANARAQRRTAATDGAAAADARAQRRTAAAASSNTGAYKRAAVGVSADAHAQGRAAAANGTAAVDGAAAADARMQGRAAAVEGAAAADARAQRRTAAADGAVANARAQKRPAAAAVSSDEMNARGCASASAPSDTGMHKHAAATTSALAATEGARMSKRKAGAMQTDVAVSSDGAKKKRNRALDIALVVCIVVLVAALAALAYLALSRYVLPERAFQQISSEDTTLAELNAQNSDCVARVVVDDTNIDYPVMCTPEDPEYYLYRNFEKEYSAAGTPFFGDGSTPESLVMLVHGHHMRAGTMFADLVEFDDSTFAASHDIHFETLVDGKKDYQVVAAAYVDISSDCYEYWNYVGDLDESGYNSFVAQMKSLSIYDSGITPTYGQKLLMLSTCTYGTSEERLVVLAVQKGTY